MAEFTKEDLGLRCPDHPTAEVRHSWVRRQVRIMGVVNPSLDTDSDHTYQCATCWRYLLPKARTQ